MTFAIDNPAADIGVDHFDQAATSLKAVIVDRRDQSRPRPRGTRSVVLEHLLHEGLLASGIEIVGPGLDSGREHRLAVEAEGARAGDHRRAGLQQLPECHGVVERHIPDRDLAAQVLGEDLELGPVAAGKHDLGAAPSQLGGDQPARVPGGSVDRDWPGLRGGFGHLGAS